MQVIRFVLLCTVEFDIFLYSLQCTTFSGQRINVIDCQDYDKKKITLTIQ